VAKLFLRVLVII